MTENKYWWESRTVWGAIVAVGASIAGAFGVTVGADDQSAVSEIIPQIIAGIGGLVAIVGRIVASKPIGTGK